jgi:hypothetical protein
VAVQKSAHTEVWKRRFWRVVSIATLCHIATKENICIEINMFGHGSDCGSVAVTRAGFRAAKTLKELAERPK